MSAQVRIEPQGDHEYLVRLDDDGVAPAETRVRVSPAVLRRVSGSAAKKANEATEERVVEYTVQWLLKRQQAADLPQLIDLDDVAAGYEDYLDELVQRLSPAPAEGMTSDS